MPNSRKNLRRNRSEMACAGPVGRPISAREALHSLQYEFNSQLELRHTKTGEPFKFIDQAHYEELADAVADYIQESMVQEYGMQRIDLPLEDFSNLNEKRKEGNDKIDQQLQCPIFHSSKIQVADVVLILLCGSGRVVSGQWARSLCINDSLKAGSVLPFLDWAKENSFGVVVLNPNKNAVETEEGLQRIPYNDSSEAHVTYTWEAFCKNLLARHFIMVAHSYGGVSTCRLLKHHGAEVLKRLRCVAFTDSAHSGFSVEDLSREAKHFLAEHCINWASSQEELDTILEYPLGDRSRKIAPGLESEQRNTPPFTCCKNTDMNSVPARKDSFLIGDIKINKRHSNPIFKRKRITEWFGSASSICKVVSAGTVVHEETTMSAFPSISKFLTESLQRADSMISDQVQERDEENKSTKDIKLQ